MEHFLASLSLESGSKLRALHTLRAVGAHAASG